MTTKYSFFIVLRIVFVFFSIVFTFAAADKWDKFSFYMQFMYFLPDLSLVFILWTVWAMIFSLCLWIVIYLAYKAIPKFFNISFELLIMLLLIGGLPLFIKRTYFEDISVSDVLGVSHYVLLILGGAVLIGILLFLRKYAEKMLNWLNASINPLVWFFTGLLILSVPLSFIRTGSSAGNSVSLGVAETYPEALKRPNIILITMDSLTALDMQVYGYDRPTTPFISGWAKDAVVFNRAYAVSNWTPPTTMSLMTSQMPWTHRVWYQNVFRHADSYENNLPSVLKDNGYSAYSFIQIQHAHPQSLGINEAFLVKPNVHTFEIQKKWWFDKLANIFRNRPIVKTWIFDDNYIANTINFYRPETFITLTPPEMVYNRFWEHSSMIGERNHYFVWLHVCPPRIPYLPPEPYIGMFGDAGKFNSDLKQYRSGVLGKYNPEKQGDADILRKRYDEFIVYADEQFRLFISQLSKTFDMSNTIIILSSDHGESFSHGKQGHASNHLYEPLVRVPLIIKMPLEIKSKVINMPVSQIDIAPTILELAGITPPEWMEGRSLVPLIKGGTFEHKPVFSMQLIKNRLFGNPIVKGTIAVWEGDYKLIYYLEDKKVQLFNLKFDPDESVNIADKNPQVKQRLTKLIQDNIAAANSRIMRGN